MTALEANQEAEDDLMEGTAVYATTRTLELMKEGGYKPLMSQADDPWFGGFAQAGAYFDKEIKALAEARGDSMEAKSKCYPYGNFQALLLSRLFPGWQDGFFQSGKLLAADLLERLGAGGGAPAEGGSALADRYPWPTCATSTPKSFASATGPGCACSAVSDGPISSTSSRRANT